MDLGGDSGGGRHKKKRKGKRVGVHMDMTPMVDIAFLLLTFFMLTTVFSRPQAMEINLPPADDVETDVPESTVLTLRGLDNDQLYWNMGADDPQSITYDDLADVLARQKQALGEDLIVIMKVNRQGSYDNIVNMLDDIKVGGIGKFSIAEFTPQDSSLVGQMQSGATPAAN